MKQDRKQAALKHALGDGRVRSGHVASMQQPRHAKRSLECVLEIVVTGIHRLVVPIAPGKALNGPAEHSRNEH
jgi:hypothetical protein